MLRNTNSLAAAYCAFALLMTVLAIPHATAEMPLVTENKARALVVTAPRPSPTVEYAVDELVRHVEEATGVRLSVTTENNIPAKPRARIYIGDTKAARKSGIEIDDLGPDTFVLKTVENRLFIAGKENRNVEPLDFGRKSLRGGGGGPGNPYGGPLFGVYELLRREVGVRWLWPGELGTFVPHTADLVVPSVDETVSPKLDFRDYWLRVSQKFPNKGELFRKVSGNISKDVYKTYGKDVRIYARRHRQGYSVETPRGGHRIAGIRMKQVRKEHPEWLAMNAEGERTGPRLCVSNPDLAKAIVQGWEGDKYLALHGADSEEFCQCEECLAWDAQQESKPGDKDYIASDRYAKFWKRIYDLAVKKNPDVIVTTYLYNNYWPAPLNDIQLNKNIHAQFVPWGSGWVSPVWFPKTRKDLEWLKAQWLGWAETGITMYYRPNDVLSGYTMPALNTWQRGNFIRFAYRNGMQGMQVDSLIGHWSVRGPELYMYFRLMSDPEMTVQQIRNDFFEAFGPAAEHVEAYFDYWESHQYTLLENGRWRSHWNNLSGVDKEYTPKHFHHARSLLDKALKAARNAERSDYAERVEFLMAGLEHARLCARFVGAVENLPAPKQDGNKKTDEIQDTIEFTRAKKALSRLLKFREEHQYPPPISLYTNTRSLYGNEADSYKTKIKKLLNAAPSE